MPFITRRKRLTSRLSLTVYQRYELLTGEIMYTADNSYDGYGNGGSTDLRDFIDDEMRADWAANRDALLAFWKLGKDFMDLPKNPPWLTAYEFDRDAPPWAVRELDGKTDADMDRRHAKEAEET